MTETMDTFAWIFIGIMGSVLLLGVVLVVFMHNAEMDEVRQREARESEVEPFEDNEDIFAAMDRNTADAVKQHTVSAHTNPAVNHAFGFDQENS